MLLDGQGADKMLGGYEQYFQHYVSSLREAGEGAPAGQGTSRNPATISSRIGAVSLFDPGQDSALRHAVAGLTGKGTNMLFGMRRRDVAERLRQVNAAQQDHRFNPLTSTLYQDTFGKYLTTLLRYGDRNSMAHSREVRLPFCDHRIAEFVFSLPPWYLMGNAQTKRILRESMRGILQEKIRARWNKQGFRPPQDLWFRGPLFEMARALCVNVSETSTP